MYSVSLLDEAPLRPLSTAELVSRNSGLQMYVQRAKEGSQWAMVGALQHGRKSALASTAPFDTSHGTDEIGRSVFDTSSAKGRAHVAHLLWAYLGLPQNDVERQNRFARMIVPQRTLEYPLVIRPDEVITWFAATRQGFTASADRQLVQNGRSAYSAIDLRTSDVAAVRQLEPGVLEARVEDMVVDWERTSALDGRHYTGTLTLLQGGRQHRFRNVHWPSHSRAVSGDSAKFVNALAEVIGVNKRDAKLMKPLLRERFSKIAPLRQAYYDVSQDVNWLIEARSVQNAVKSGELAYEGARPSPPPDTDAVINPGDFLLEPGDDRPRARPIHDERGSLLPAVAPLYRVVPAGRSLNLLD